MPLMPHIGNWEFGFWVLVFGLWSLVFGLWFFVLALRSSPFALCSLPFALCSSPLALCPYLFASKNNRQRQLQDPVIRLNKKLLTDPSGCQEVQPEFGTQHFPTFKF